MTSTPADQESSKLSNAQIVGAAAKFIDELVEAIGDRTIPIQQIRMLLAIYLHRELMQTDIPKFAGLAGASISRNIDRLGKDGPKLIEAETDDFNRKFKVVRMTPEGRTLVDGVARKVSRYFNKP